MKHHRECDRTIEEAVRLAAVDPEFRARLLADPPAVLAELHGRPLPGDFRILFVDEAEFSKVVILPELQAATVELTDEDLERVAGGCLNTDCGDTLIH